MPLKHIPQVLDASKGPLCHLKDQRALDFSWPVSPDPAAVTCCLAVPPCLCTRFTEPRVGKVQVGKLEESAEGTADTFIFCRLAQQL